MAEKDSNRVEGRVEGRREGGELEIVRRWRELVLKQERRQMKSEIRPESLVHDGKRHGELTG